MWFDVDKDGLAKLLERKGKEFILYELIQNAWDENTTDVHVSVLRVGSTPYVELTVSDDNPKGFANLSHAFTLFAESNKKGDAEKRGRFNLGEKLVLAMCVEAEIHSASGTVRFDASGRKFQPTNKRGVGTKFTGTLRMTNKEIALCVDAIDRLISPPGITTTYNIGGLNGTVRHPQRTSTFLAVLPTEFSDAEGNMRRTQRKTEIMIYETTGQAYLYEMGIPVVEIEGRCHVNVMQKVPLNFDRDNVTPSYLALIYKHLVENQADNLTADDVNQPWVKTALEEHGEDLSDGVINDIVRLRFGEKRVIYDPSDPEANNIAVTQGYQVVHGGAMSKAEWAAVKRVEAILPAGQVTPSQPDPTVPAIVVPMDAWTDNMLLISEYTRTLARRLMNVVLNIQVINNPTVGEIASYARWSANGATMTFNIGRLGRKWFDGALTPINDLIIHEFGHQYSGNHLSREYYHALTRLGAELTQLALDDPDLFKSARSRSA